MPTKREKLAKAIKQGLITDEKSALLFVLKEKEREELKKEIIADIPTAKKGERGQKGEVGETGPAGKDGINGKAGRDGADGKTPVIPIDKIVSTSTTRVYNALKDKIPTIPQIVQELPQNGEAVRDSLEMLLGEERLDASAIKNLPEVTKQIFGGGSPAGALRMDGANSPMSDISWGGYKITNLADPTADQDGATKKYVDDNAGSMVYPASGIALSNGTGWDTSITNNSANWDTAYGWGNHADYGYVTGTPWASMGYLTSTWGGNVNANGYALTSVSTINGTVVAGINFEIGTANQLFLNDGNFRPVVNNDINLGADAKRWKNSYFTVIDATGAITTTTTVQAEQLTSTDDITMAGLLTNTMLAGDVRSIYVDGVTNDFNAVWDSTTAKYFNYFTRDVNCGDGTRPQPTVNLKVDHYLKHTNALITDGGDSSAGMSFTLWDTSTWTLGGATGRTSNKYGMNGIISDSATYDLTGTGAITQLNTSVNAIVSDTSTLVNSGGTGGASTFWNIGLSSTVTSTPTVTSGTWNVRGVGVYVSVTGNAAGSSTNYGLYIPTCTGANSNYGIYDGSLTTWVKNGGDFLFRTDGSKFKMGAGDDVYFSYTGTYWDWYVSLATSAIRVNQGQIDTDFIVYGDTAAMLTLDAGTLGATFGGGITIPVASVITVGTNQVIGARVVDARIDDVVNSGDATTDGVIDAMRDAMIAHGLMAAA